ncbi:MAG: fibronectin type III domain-containing protein, partial [Coriobacteriia bacterium]
GTGACHSSASNAAGGSNIYSQLTTSTNNSTHHDVMPAAQAATGARIECSSCHNVHKDGRTRVYSDPDNIAVAIDDGAGAYIDASGYVYALVGAQHDARAPLISNVTLDATTSAQVLVGWALDEIASSYVEIGPTTAYELGAIDASEPTTTPEVVLSTLQAGTLYHFRVRSVDGLGNESVSADAMYRAGNLFHTPVIVPVGEVLSGGSTSVTLQWGAIQPADDHAVEYYVELYSGTTLINQSGWITATSKTYSFNGYGAFNWRVRARDAGHTWVQTAWSANDYFGISYWESRPAGIAVKVPTARVSRLYPLGSFLPGLAVPTSAVPVTTTFAEEYSVDSDRIVLEVEPPGGLNTTVAAAAGWESGGAMVPAPASPGTAVSAETLARAATVDGVHWRTDLASIDRDWNWHVVRFPVTGAGGSTLTLRWTGHGEPTVGYPVRLAFYNNETQSWVTEEIGDAPTDRSASTEVQPAAAGFCFACHDGEMPSGVVDPVGLYPVAATWDTGAADAHGSAGGTGVGGSLKAPFERNDPPIACNTCHASHGSQSVYHFPATVNGTAVARVTSGSSSALCSACHVGGLVDWHAECEGCHVADGHWGDQRGVLPTESDDCFSCHTHGSSWTHPDACLFCHSDGELQALGAGPHGPWTYDNTF